MKVTSSDELAHGLLRLSEALSRRAGTSALAVLDESGVTLSQTKALRVLERHDGVFGVGDLADALGVSVPTASRTADALCRSGYAGRQVSRADRRGRELELSASGRDLLDRLTAARVADLRVVVDGLSGAQRRRLGAALAELGLEAPVAA